MIIKSITLTNYRLYKGVNRIDFSSNKERNIFLISGENGFGKTTFLHSLIWCLYGKMIAEVETEVRKDINSNGYNSFLHSNLNNEVAAECECSVSDAIKERIKKHGYTSDTEKLKVLTQYSVSIEFGEVVIPSLPCASIRVTRSYDIIQDLENVEILIDNVRNELTNEIGPDVFINDFILNKDIARFFFFDSEQIVSLAETNSVNDRRHLCSAYNEVLGVRKYEDLKKNLENVRVRFRRKSSDTVSREKLISMMQRQESVQISINDNRQQVSVIEKTIKDLRDKDSEYQLRLMREGNNTTTSEIERLTNLIEVLKKKDIDYKKQLKVFLDYAPLAIIGRLLEETKSQVDNDHKQIDFVSNQLSRNNVVSDITSDILILLQNVPLSNEASLQIQQGVQDIMNKYKGDVNSGDVLLSISETDYEEFMSVYNNITTTYRSEFVRLADDYRKNKHFLERNSRRLSNINAKENDELIKNYVLIKS